MYYEYLDCILSINPFIKEEDLAQVVEVNEWDVLIYLKDGRKYIYDRFTKYHRQIFYDDVSEIPEELERKRFALSLQEIMERKRITQEELAERIGVSRMMVSNYIKGRSIPNYSVVVRMAKTLNCSTEDFRYDDYNKYLEEE